MKSLEHRTGLIFDLFFCIIFMPLLAVFGPERYWWGSFPVFAAIATAYLYATYFVTKYLHLPKLILSRSYYKIAVITLIFLVLTYLLTLYPLPEVDFVIPSMSEYQTRVRNYNVAISLWFMFTVVLCYSLTVSFVKELYERLLLQNIAENQRNKAQLAVFKAQISPHFLFNTLNSLYSLVIGTSQKAEDAFIKFTEILKYSYTTIDNEYVALSEEIAYIQNYIDLQLIRLDTHTKVEWNYSVDDDTRLIPPMIFLTFVENAFKYGTSTSRDCTIDINLELKDGLLRFETENMVLRHRDEFRQAVPVGLENCRSRLSALFPQKHQLLTTEKDSVFKVTLKIDLN